ncbi:hypothetical protein KSS87_022605 [Heliosperma pusillum]|nr:hypothetical protein KSS87_022605 [Heliosperma pusillum]
MESATTSTPTSSLILYSHWYSSCSWRVRFALNLKGLAYQYKSVDLVNGQQFTPEFEKINPLHYVPVLVDDGVVVADSLAILMYLEDKYPQRQLLPADPRLKAISLQVASVVGSSMQPLHMGGVQVFGDGGLGRTVEWVGDGVWLSSQVADDGTWKGWSHKGEGTAGVTNGGEGWWWFGQTVNLQMSIAKKIGEEAALLWVQQIINKGFYALETLLENLAGKYSIGDEVSMADVFLAPQISIAMSRFHIEMSNYPTLNRVYESCRNLPEYQASLPERQPDARI